MPIFRNFWKGVPTIFKGGQNDIFALKDKQKYALKIGMASVLIFKPLFEFSLKNMFRVTKNKLENHSLENQTWSLTEYWGSIVWYSIDC